MSVWRRRPYPEPHTPKVVIKCSHDLSSYDAGINDACNARLFEPKNWDRTYYQAGFEKARENP